MRRWAAGARERIWCECDPAARAVKAGLESRLAGLLPGKSRVLPGGALGDDEERAGRVLSVLGQMENGFEWRSGRRGRGVTRGHVFGFRAGAPPRALGTPRPTSARPSGTRSGGSSPGVAGAIDDPLRARGDARPRRAPLIAEEGGMAALRAPSRRGALHADAEDLRGAGPDLHERGRHGARAAAGAPAQAAAFLSITSGFAGMREAPELEEPAPGEPVDLISGRCRTWVTRCASGRTSAARSELGGLRGHPLLSRGASRPGTDELWSRFRDYFVSVYDNTLFELGLFTLAACSLLWGGTLRGCHRKAWRKRIPLVVGGWGTRGKSGTERLKAASSTRSATGSCRRRPAARRCSSTRTRSRRRANVPLPVLRQGDDLGAEERDRLADGSARRSSSGSAWRSTPPRRCPPAHWIRDDLSTITNAYPDHEDLQGPAGIDIPRLIAHLHPEKSKAVTTEEQMLPDPASRRRRS